MFDREKFAALVLYVIWRTSDVPDFGITKLNKVLWFADARAYEASGKSITGETYIRQKYGPVPKHMQQTLMGLALEEKIRLEPEPHYDFTVQHFTTMEQPDTSVFTNDEMVLIDWWIKHVADDHTAVSISEKSHDYGWKLAKQGEELPYKAFLARRIRQLRDDELEWARTVAKELGEPD